MSTVFRKNSSGDSLLRADSCHPSHVFKAVPIGQFQCLRLNCSTDNEFMLQSIDLRDRFLARGSPLQILKAVFVRAFRENRLNSLYRPKTVKKATRDDMPLFITSYRKQYYEIKNIVKKYLLLLNGDEKLQKVLQHGCKFVT